MVCHFHSDRARHMYNSTAIASDDTRVERRRRYIPAGSVTYERNTARHTRSIPLLTLSRSTRQPPPPNSEVKCSYKDKKVDGPMQMTVDYPNGTFVCPDPDFVRG
jgi:hypothetical protein